MITNSSRINPDTIRITGKNSVKISNQNMTGSAVGDSSGRAGGDTPYHYLLCCRFSSSGSGDVHLVNITGGTITNSRRINPDSIKITGKHSVKISNQNMTGAAAGDCYDYQHNIMLVVSLSLNVRFDYS
jgi:hypothetical protein